MNERILLIDDDESVHEVAGAYLERDGFVVYHAVDGADALGLNAERQPSLLILDRCLPDMSGETLLQVLRRRSNVPVLMISGHAGADERVYGLSLGADDYLTKPFSGRELVARARAVLRRRGDGSQEGSTLTFDEGRLTIDTWRHEVRFSGQPLLLTPTEYKLLLALAQHPGRAYSRNELAYSACGHDFEGYERVIDQHVKNLRRKLEPDPSRPRYVTTVRGYGYTLSADTA
jgi:two-component system response regulator ResD